MTSTPEIGQNGASGGAWTKEVEHITLGAANSDTRVVGVTAAREGSGATLLSRLVAASFASAGRKTLLIDLSATLDATNGTTPDEDATWAPGDTSPRGAIKEASGGFDRLSPTLTVGSRGRFNNIEKFRDALASDLSEYAQIVVDLPAILDASHEQVNPVAAALACDAVYFIAVTGVTTRHEARTAALQLSGAGANIAGVVLNDIDHVTVGQEIVGYIRFLRRIAPEFHDRLHRIALKSPLLN